MRYEYEEKWGNLNYSDEHALLFYVFARAAASTFAYVPVPQKAGLDSMLNFVPPTYHAALDKIEYQLPDFEPVNEETMSTLIHALSFNHAIKIHYLDLSGCETKRSVMLMRLLNYAGVWYAIAYDIDKKEMRTFRVGRIESIQELQNTKIDAPSQELVSDFINASYGMFKGTNTVAAVVRFYSWAAVVVQNEIWHKEQIKINGIDSALGPYVELTLPTGNFKELLGRILRFGSAAKPIEPPELVQLWKVEIQNMVNIAKE